MLTLPESFSRDDILDNKSHNHQHYCNTFSLFLPRLRNRSSNQDTYVYFLTATKYNLQHALHDHCLG